MRIRKTSVGFRFVGIALLLVMTGCVSTRYVAVHTIPGAPVMTVIPASVADDDMEFADRVVEALISHGVPIVERPAIFASYVETSGSSSSASLSELIGGGGSSTSGAHLGATSSEGETRVQAGDVVDLYEETDADLVIVATASDHWLRIVDRSSRRVLFSGSLLGQVERSNYSYRGEMAKILNALRGESGEE